MSVPAFNISVPYTLISSPEISSNFLTIFLSSSVVVGDFKINVSEAIALSINVAIVLSISTSFSLYILYKTVAVHPTGSAL